MEKAEKNLKPYQFLIWLDNFIQEREGRIKLPHCRSQGFKFDSASIDTAEQVSGHSDLEGCRETSQAHKLILISYIVNQRSTQDIYR